VFTLGLSPGVLCCFAPGYPWCFGTGAGGDPLTGTGASPSGMSIYLARVSEREGEAHTALPGEGATRAPIMGDCIQSCCENIPEGVAGSNGETRLLCIQLGSTDRGPGGKRLRRRGRSFAVGIEVRGNGREGPAMGPFLCPLRYLFQPPAKDTYRGTPQFTPGRLSAPRSLGRGYIAFESTNCSDKWSAFCTLFLSLLA
jgi:hypothetical protein